MKTRHRLLSIALTISATTLLGCKKETPPATDTTANSVPATKITPPPSRPAPVEVPITLYVGSTAPTIDVANWLSDGDGKYPHVTEFEAGKVYVVEFWATWCGPCVASMPHLVELQEKYGPEGVQIISISSENIDVVQAFLAKQVPSSESEETYAQLTSAYTLACDPDRSVYADYMQAAGINSIPSAFLVGKTGLIEWQGHPMEMEPVIQSLLRDEWDREAYKKVLASKAAYETLLGKLAAPVQAKKFDEALALVDEFSKGEDSQAAADQIAGLKFELLLGMERVDEAIPAGKSFLESSKGNLEVLNAKTWSIHSLAQERTVPNEILTLSRDLLQDALDASGEKKDASALDTLAALQADLGDYDAAIATQQQAVDNADGQLKAQLEAALKSYKAKIKE